MKHLDTVDVTAAELREYQTHPILGPLLKIVSEKWTLGMEDRDKDVRIGSVKIYKDEHDYLHLDFTTRFRINES